MFKLKSITGNMGAPCPSPNVDPISLWTLARLIDELTRDIEKLVFKLEQH